MTFDNSGWNEYLPSYHLPFHVLFVCQNCSICSDVLIRLLDACPLVGKRCSPEKLCVHYFWESCRLLKCCAHRVEPLKWFKFWFTSDHFSGTSRDVPSHYTSIFSYHPLKGTLLFEEAKLPPVRGSLFVLVSSMLVSSLYFLMTHAPCLSFFIFLCVCFCFVVSVSCAQQLVWNVGTEYIQYHRAVGSLRSSQLPRPNQVTILMSSAAYCHGGEGLKSNELKAF